MRGTSDIEVHMLKVYLFVSILPFYRKTDGQEVVVPRALSLHLHDGHYSRIGLPSNPQRCHMSFQMLHP